MAELSSCNTDQMACKAKNIYCLGFYRKCLLVPGGDGWMLVKCDRGQMGSMGAGGAAELTGSSSPQTTRKQAGEPQDLDFLSDEFPSVAPCEIIQSRQGRYAVSLWPSKN